MIFSLIKIRPQPGRKHSIIEVRGDEEKSIPQHAAGGGHDRRPTPCLPVLPAVPRLSNPARPGEAGNWHC
jgi:hypothetical protein